MLKRIFPFNLFKNTKDLDEYTNEIPMDDSDFECDDIVYNTYDKILEKCNYGDNIEKLNEHERILFITQIVEGEVNNGGFSQFFYNSSGNFSNEIVEAFTQIGALKTAEICKGALTVFPDKAPTNRAERQDLLEKLDCDDALEKYDEAFYEYEDNLLELNTTYIEKYSEFFK